jgi:hypothetical protein
VVGAGNGLLLVAIGVEPVLLAFFIGLTTLAALLDQAAPPPIRGRHRQPGQPHRAGRRHRDQCVQFALQRLDEDGQVRHGIRIADVSDRQGPRVGQGDER